VRTFEEMRNFPSKKRRTKRPISEWVLPILQLIE
jgi:hypothetical protein